jgi:hemerythrin-like metal-binding protein
MAKPAAGKKSNRLYEALPFLYMLAGALVMALIKNGWGIFSGALLMLAGAMVLLMRRHYRSVARGAKALRQERQSERERGGGQGLMPLEWRREYECGNTLIDAQHRSLFASANALREAIIDGKTQLDLELVVDDLLGDINRHFQVEDSLLARTDSADARAHKELHQALIARARMLGEMFHRGQVSAVDLYKFVSSELVDGHIMQQDRAVLVAH